MKVKDIVIGETYNRVKVVQDLGRPTSSHHHYLCVCPICGAEFKTREVQVGKVRSCKNCFGTLQRKDITGCRFGRLTAIKFIERANNDSMWLCRCDCGKERTVGIKRLTMKKGVRSCGCLAKEIRKECGRKAAAYMRKSVSPEFSKKYPYLHKHPAYRSWIGLLSRCNDPNCPDYPRYGGRGIKVCDRWLQENRGFENFVNDMGDKPSATHSIDRIDVNGNYCPENCRWATISEQANNKRTSLFYTFFGRTQTLKQWCNEVGCNYATALSRRERGISDFNELFYGKKTETE